MIYKRGDAIVGSGPVEKYFRVISLSIAFYDYALTLPTEYRFYRNQPHFLQMSLACILFILIRYTSVLLMIVSNYGVFSTAFTPESCRRYYYVSPVFKVVQSMVSQAILGVRTFGISGRNRYLGTFLLAYYTITVSLEWFFNLYRRIPQSIDGGCISGVNSPHPTSWAFYMVAMAYDLVTLTISTVYLLRFETYSGRFKRFIRIMLYDGLIFFMALTAVNVLNLILYQSGSIVGQSTGSSLAYAIIWIMSQRLLIHLQKMSVDLHVNNAITGTRQVIREQVVESALRSPFETSKGLHDHSRSREPTRASDVELDVRIHIDCTVTVDCPVEEAEEGESTASKNEGV